MALIFCPQCGRQVSDKAPACPGCGYDISRLVNLNAQEAVNAQTPQEEKKIPKQKKKRKPISIVAVIAGVLLILVGLMKLSQPSASGSSDNSGSDGSAGGNTDISYRQQSVSGFVFDLPVGWEITSDQNMLYATDPDHSDKGVPGLIFNMYVGTGQTPSEYINGVANALINQMGATVKQQEVSGTVGSYDIWSIGLTYPDGDQTTYYMQYAFMYKGYLISLATMEYGGNSQEMNQIGQRFVTSFGDDGSITPLEGAPESSAGEDPLSALPENYTRYDATNMGVSFGVHLGYNIAQDGSGAFYFSENTDSDGHPVPPFFKIFVYPLDSSPDAEEYIKAKGALLEMTYGEDNTEISQVETQELLDRSTLVLAGSYEANGTTVYVTNYAYNLPSGRLVSVEATSQGIMTEQDFTDIFWMLTTVTEG